LLQTEQQDDDPSDWEDGKCGCKIELLGEPCGTSVFGGHSSRARCRRAEHGGAESDGVAARGPAWCCRRPVLRQQRTAERTARPPDPARRA
jgi:hypothetical protein